MNEQGVLVSGLHCHLKQACIVESWARTASLRGLQPGSPSALTTVRGSGGHHPAQSSPLPKQREMRMRRLLAWSAAGASVRSKAKGSAPKLKLTGEKESIPATG